MQTYAFDLNNGIARYERKYDFKPNRNFAFIILFSPWLKFFLLL